MCWLKKEFNTYLPFFNELFQGTQIVLVDEVTFFYRIPLMHSDRTIR